MRCFIVFSETHKAGEGELIIESHHKPGTDGSRLRVRGGPLLPAGRLGRSGLELGRKVGGGGGSLIVKS